MALTTQQLLLLNNLMYLPDISIESFAEGSTVRDMLNSFTAQPNHNYGSYTTPEEWSNIVAAVRRDPQLMDVQIVCGHADNAEGGGGGLSALFADPSTGEAVVAFQGTASREWKDNFLGGARTGAADGVSTPQQENALNWYHDLQEHHQLDSYSSITVTGHSKGGNKAKYITVRDDSVSRCVSFDGQGFSDDFVRTYRDAIALNQNKISNHNVDYDYVNLLLNDFGSETFYAGQDIGAQGFAENHCPNTFLKFEPDGTAVMTEAPRPAEMEALDHYFNSMIRSMPADQREKLFPVVGDLAQEALGGEGDAESMVRILLNPKNRKHGAYVLAYTIAYLNAHPEAKDDILSVMEKFHMDGFAEVVEKASGILSEPWFPALLAVSGNAALEITRVKPFLQLIRLSTGWNLTDSEFRSVGLILIRTGIRIPTIDARDRGADIAISGGSLGKISAFAVSPAALSEATQQFARCSAELAAVSQELQSILSQMDGMFEMLLRWHLRLRMRAMEQYSAQCAELSRVLEDALSQYEGTEAAVVRQFEWRG